MKYKVFTILLFALAVSACNQKHEDLKDEHDHEEPKLQFTAYNLDYEVFIETDAFVVGESANILSHFSTLPDFKALEEGIITVKCITGGQLAQQTLIKPTRKGIYSFDITPVASGSASLIFEIKKNEKVSTLEIKGVTIYKTEEQADEAAEKAQPSMTNTVVFTKEQSWKVDFAAELPMLIPFGQIIKTSAQIQPAQGDEIIVTSRTNGIISYTGSIISEGQSVTAGQSLLTITGNNMADNNSAVRYAESKNNYEKSKGNYERLSKLAEDKIVSEKELLSAKTEYENYKAVYDNLRINFSSSGQKISSPMAGYIRQIFIKNGQYIEAGQPIIAITQNRNLLIKADVRQRFAPFLSSISSAVITNSNGKTYTMEELNGKILSVGQSLGNDNFLIPISLQIENRGAFIPGEFVELYLKTLTGTKSLTIPNGALLEDQGAFFVFVQITPELFEKREIKVGATDGLRTEVISGLQSNERVVTKGAILVKLSQSSGALDPHAGHVH